MLKKLLKNITFKSLKKTYLNSKYMQIIICTIILLCILIIVILKRLCYVVIFKPLTTKHSVVRLIKIVQYQKC